ncbi:MAG TPA: DUF4446 family protein [Solirubrobacteraceae bacterium]|nr:DUF4446 family protein [Solirubrobacteraceae bacterium]
MATSLTDTHGIIAIAAAAVAVVALIWCVILSVSVRRLRRGQTLVLGDSGEQDLVTHAVGVEAALHQIQDQVRTSGARLDARLGQIEGDLRGVISHRALVRYDAYNELSGRQSMSIALLDDERSGIVLSCIHHRDQARVYGKQVREGRSELELSPEEAEAVRLAITGGGEDQAAADGHGG